MDITLTIPDTKAPRVVNAICANYGYQTDVPLVPANPDTPEATMPNPETKAQFTKKQVINFLKEHVIAYEANQASETARTTARDKADSEITIS